MPIINRDTDTDKFLVVETRLKTVDITAVAGTQGDSVTHCKLEGLVNTCTSDTLCSALVTIHEY